MKYKLYIKVENDIIVNSLCDWQQDDFTGWIKEKDTDNKYPDYEVCDDNGISKYKYINNKRVARTKTEISTELKNKTDESKDITLCLNQINKNLSFAILDEINALRVKAGLEERTVDQLKQVVIDKF